MTAPRQNDAGVFNACAVSRPQAAPLFMRYHLALMCAGAFGALALVLRSPLLLAAVAVALAVVFGIGIATPRFCFFAPFICRGFGAQKQVALTFDDGPDGESTASLLALLRERGVTAAFFGIGEKVASSPELAAQIVREGHMLENHTHAHSHFTNFYLSKRQHAEIARAQAVIRNTTGVAPRFYRPPAGLSNSCTARAVENAGLELVGWSVRSFDTLGAAPEKIVARIMRNLHPGAIILLHDGGIPAGKLCATVRLLLDALDARGYHVARLDALIENTGENKNATRARKN